VPVPAARVPSGVAMLPGRPASDLPSVAALQRSLLATPRIALTDPASGGSSGMGLAPLFQRWGLAAQLRPPGVRVQGGLVAQKPVDGSADLAIHPISEILALPGVRGIGPLPSQMQGVVPLPSQIQNHAAYAAALSARSSQPQAAQARRQALQAEGLRSILQSQGMEIAP